MNSYYTAAFFGVFLPLVVIVYALFPKKARWIVLLLASYAFFFLLSRKLIVLLIASTVSIYLVGLVLDRLRAKGELTAAKEDTSQTASKTATPWMRLVFALGVLFNLAPLVAFKHMGDLESLISGLPISVELPHWAAPVGISFYTLMALSYLIDVYRGNIPADKHLGRVALFLSFFPQIMEGPIARYQQTAHQLTAGNRVTAANLYAGSLRILWGLAKKVIVADRLDAFVACIYAYPGQYDGGMVALGALLYLLQLYCDFSGTMDVGLGMARIFGIALPENFRQPFFSRTLPEFWQRWNISLGTWMRDYIFWPVMASRPVKWLSSAGRKARAPRWNSLLAYAFGLAIAWFVSGLWHGAGGQYMFVSFYFFALIFLGRLLTPAFRKVMSALHVNRKSAWFHAFQILRTLVLIVIGVLFFGAVDFSSAWDLFTILVQKFSFASFANGKVLDIRLDIHDFAIVAIVLALALVVGIVKERGIDIAAWASGKGIVFQWTLWLVLNMCVIVFGAYGVDYAQVHTIYSLF